MARDIEILAISSNLVAGALLPTSNAVLGSTADSKTAATLGGSLRRTDYKAIAAASTWSLSTAGIINTLTVIPNTTGAATVILSDGSTAILSISAAAHSIDPRPYTLNLGGIVATSTLGFKIVTGASVAVVVSGGFGTPTTA